MANLIFHLSDGGTKTVANLQPSPEVDWLLGAFLTGSDAAIGLNGNRDGSYGECRMSDVVRIEVTR